MSNLWNKIKGLFHKDEADYREGVKLPNMKGVTLRIVNNHDYTRRAWGHDFSISKIDGDTISMSGWGYGLQEGDYITLPSNKGTSLRYLLTSVKYYSDPPDMWQAVANYRPGD